MKSGNPGAPVKQERARNVSCACSARALCESAVMVHFYYLHRLLLLQDTMIHKHAHTHTAQCHGRCRVCLFLLFVCFFFGKRRNKKKVNRVTYVISVNEHWLESTPFILQPNPELSTERGRGLGSQYFCCMSHVGGQMWCIRVRIQHQAYLGAATWRWHPSVVL